MDLFETFIDLTQHFQGFLSSSQTEPPPRQAQYVYLTSKIPPIPDVKIPLYKWQDFCIKFYALSATLPHTVAVKLTHLPLHNLFLDLIFDGPEAVVFEIKIDEFVEATMRKVFVMFNDILDDKMFVIRADRSDSRGVRLNFVNISLSFTDYVELCPYLQNELEYFTIDMKKYFPGCSILFQQASEFPLPKARDLNDIDSRLITPTHLHVLERGTRKRPIRINVTSVKLDKDNIKSISQFLPNVLTFDDLERLTFPIMTRYQSELLNQSIFCVQSGTLVSSTLLRKKHHIHVATLVLKNDKKKQFLYKNLAAFEQSSRHTYTVTESEYRYFADLDRTSAFSEYSRSIHYHFTNMTNRFCKKFANRLKNDYFENLLLDI